MRRHGTSSARKARANSGQKLPFRGEYPAHLDQLPPRLWELDDAGGPQWISRIPNVDRAPWVSILPPRTAAGVQPATGPVEAFVDRFRPASMPIVFELAPGVWKPRDRRGRPGRPLTEDADTLVSLAAAWASDLRDVSTWELGRQLSPSAERYSARRYAKRRLDAGRGILHQAGVLPWLLWKDGVLPAGWWADGRFDRALRGWYHVHVLSKTAARREADHPQ